MPRRLCQYSFFRSAGEKFALVCTGTRPIIALQQSDIFYPTGRNCMHSFYLAPEHLDLITVDGPDAAKFLQGQLTCDVEALSGQNLVHGAACNNKGRVIATFVMLRHDEVYCLIFSKGLGDLFAAALKKYMPFYKCRL